MLTLTDRCQPQRLEGRVDRVSATDAFVVLDGTHVPIDDVLAIHTPHFAQQETS